MPYGPESEPPDPRDSSPEPEVSVVIPTHNRRDLLKLALHTALWQQDVNLEVIVVDDGSTDDTATVVAGVEDPRVRLIRHEESQGVSAARNRGIAEARGEWIAFLDDDDLWAPDKLSSQLEAARSGHAIWAYVGSVNIDGSQRVHGGSPPIPPEQLAALLPRWNPMPGGCSNVLVRTDVVRDLVGFDIALRILADWDLWLRVLSVGVPAFASRPLMAYRIHPANMSSDTEGMLAELEVMERHHGSTFDRAGFSRYMARRSLQMGKRREALRLLLRAAAYGSTGDLLRRLPGDVGSVIGGYLGAVRGRLGLPPSRRVVRRQRRAEVDDPNRSWKAEARRWLAAVPTQGALVDPGD
jgi:glycosyltransferase involved in cell wall biosynthesis